MVELRGSGVTERASIDGTGTCSGEGPASLSSAASSPSGAVAGTISSSGLTEGKLGLDSGI